MSLCIYIGHRSGCSVLQLHSYGMSWISIRVEACFSMGLDKKKAVVNCLEQETSTPMLDCKLNKVADQEPEQ